MEYKNENIEAPRTLFVEQSNLLEGAVCLKIKSDDGRVLAVHLTRDQLRRFVLDVAYHELKANREKLDDDEKLLMCHLRNTRRLMI